MDVWVYNSWFQNSDTVVGWDGFTVIVFQLNWKKN